MKDNKEILSEAFFKKATYDDNRNKRLAQYEPVDIKNSTSNPFENVAAYKVTDNEEVKKRLTGTFGVAFGNNNVKTLVSRALKTFPIVISDAVEPETAIMLKKLMEEQYAEYINLLISNQVVNLTDYSTENADGNIALQALDGLSGTDFGKTRIANTALRTGKVDTGSVFQNIPLYNLLREEKAVATFDDPLCDALMEGALVIRDEKDVQALVEFIEANADDIVELNETNTHDPSGTHFKDHDDKKYKNYNSQEDRWGYNVDSSKKVMDVYQLSAARRGDLGHMNDDKSTPIFTKITTADVILNQKLFDDAVNREIGDILTLPENKNLRDKFTKATFLLQSRRIAGIEYYQYVTLRLGIPVSDDTRLRLVRDFKVSDVRDFSNRGYFLSDYNSSNKKNRRLARNELNFDQYFRLSREDKDAIFKNKSRVERVVNDISGTKIKDYSVYAGVGAGAATAGSVLAGLLAAAGTLAFWPIAGIVIGSGALIGSGAYAISKMFYNKKVEAEKNKLNSQMGWERVEALIDAMEKSQAEIRSGKPEDNFTHKLISRTSISLNDLDQKKEYSTKTVNGIAQDVENSFDLDTLYGSTEKLVASALKESTTVCAEKTFNEIINEGYYQTEEELTESLRPVLEELETDEDYQAELLSEKVLGKFRQPMTVKYIEKSPNKDVLITPTFMARDAFAYGSTEIERRENRDRKYNQPLIMTVKFKERFSDGKYTDNELTAVIGILGKIIRIPSEEMEYILSEGTKGNTLDGFLKGGNFGDEIADLLSGSKISKDIKNLPQSADVWHNLEKVATLAAANKISGKRTNNISNAHIIFAQKEVDSVRIETGVDYRRDAKAAVGLMKRYSAFTLMIANDAGQQVYILDDQDNISWNVVPYSALAGKDSGDQLNAALTKMMRL